MSSLNKNLAKVSSVAFVFHADASANWPADSPLGAGPNGLSNAYIFYNKQNTGNSDKVKFQVGFKQPANRKDPYQVQYRMHSRYIPSAAKTKGAEWTAWTAWKSPMPSVSKQVNGVTKSVPKGTDSNPNTWGIPNLGINNHSTYVIFYTYNQVWNSTDASFDARCYQFRVRTINEATHKHGEWVYSEGLYIYRSPRMRGTSTDPAIYAGDDGQLMFFCNLRYAHRGGTFTFTDIRDSSGRNLLKKAYTAKMIVDTQRTSSSVPPKVDGFLPRSCRIPISALKRGIKPGETLYFSQQCGFDAGSSGGGLAAMHTNLPSSNPTKGVGGIAYFGRTVRTEDVQINGIKLVLTKNIDKGFVTARVYKASDPNDSIKSLTACLYYTYNGKNYTVMPHYTKLYLSRNSTTQCIGQFVFSKCPLGIKLGVKAVARNPQGSKAEAKNAITLDNAFWYIQNESNPSSLGACLQWNCKIENNTTINNTIELPYGRTKPFVAYGDGTTREMTISGEIPKKTQHPLFSQYASKEAWIKIQNNLGIYLVRGADSQMYKLAVTEVQLSEQDDSEILKVKIRGTEVE